MTRLSSVSWPLLFAFAASCGGDLNESAVIDTAAGEVTETDASAADTLASPGGALVATLSEWAVAVPLDTVSAGEYTFVVRNGGQYEHAFEVEGQGIEEETDRLAPGAGGEVTVNLRPGTYELYCPIQDEHGNHKEKGMSRTLVVRGG